MSIRFCSLFSAVVLSAFFAACGNDSATGDNSNASAGQSGGCSVTSNDDGSYTLSCVDGTEVVLHDGKDGSDGKDGRDGLDGEDGTSCSVAINMDSTIYMLICDGKVVGEISKGADGKDGVDGTSCSAAINSDSTSYVLVCDNKVVGQIYNGVDGVSCNVQDTAMVATGLTGYKLVCGDTLKGIVWNGRDGVDGTSCTAAENESSTGYVLICNGKVLGSVRNGIDGTSCTVSDTVNVATGRTGYKLMCGSEYKGVVWNGKDGQDGSDGTNGTDGTSCTVADTSDISTGRTGYKLMCGSEYKGVVWNGLDGKDGADGKDAVIASSSSGVTVSSSGSSSSNSNAAWQYMNPAISYGELVDSRDNQVYRTVTIGSQTWMAENLNYASEKSYCYNNEADSCSKYGRLYLWSAAMDSAAVFSATGKDCGDGNMCGASSLTTTYRGVCPEGWHLPSSYEWAVLFENVGGQDVAGKKLKATDGWYDDGNGDDSSGFGVLPAGYRSRSGGFSNAGSSAYFWSSTEFTSNNAYYWRFRYDYEGVLRYDRSKYSGYSVRCLRDSDEGGVALPSGSQAQPSSPITYGTLVDSRDNQSYKTIEIGSQVWMAENLNYGTANSYCYNDEADSCAKYGRLYTWADAMEACPAGWHLPDTTEWEVLFAAVGGSSVSGALLKSRDGWYNNGGGLDSYGFGVLPAGYRSLDGDFYGAGDYADFWSSTEDASSLAYDWYFYYGYEDVSRGSYYKSYGYSVRCLRDSD